MRDLNADPFATPKAPTWSAPPPATLSPGFPPPGLPPYPATNQSTNQSTKKNWMGIVSLILGVLGGGLLGFIFGLLGLGAVNRGEANNRGVALAGTLLNLLLPVVVVGAAVLAGVVFDDGSSSITPDELAKGDCIKDVGTEEANYVKVVECEEEHWGQVYHFDFLKGTEYGSSAQIEAGADELCAQETAFRDVDPAYVDRVYYTFLAPTPEAWRQGDRTVTCLLTDADESVMGDWMSD